MRTSALVRRIEVGREGKELITFVSLILIDCRCVFLLSCLAFAVCQTAEGWKLNRQLKTGLRFVLWMLIVLCVVNKSLFLCVWKCKESHAVKSDS